MVCDLQDNTVCDDITSSQQHAEEMASLRRHAAVTVHVRSRNTKVLRMSKQDSSLPFQLEQDNALMWSCETSRVETSFSKSEISSNLSENSVSANSGSSFNNNTDFCEPGLKRSNERLFSMYRLNFNNFQLILRRSLAWQYPSFLFFILLLQLTYATSVHTKVSVIRTDGKKYFK